MSMTSQTSRDPSALNERGQRLISGSLTPAQYLGITQAQLYKLATQGHGMLVRGQTQAAIDIFKGLVAASPYDSVFHCHLASAYAQAERYAESMEAYTRALQLNIANVDALSGRSELLLREGRLAEALQDIQAALRLDPTAQRESTQRARSTLMVLQQMAEAAEKGPSTRR